jgi:hypothetical protein
MWLGDEPTSNQGAMNLFDKFGGDKEKGVPFVALLDSKGSLIVNSYAGGKDNIGYPSDDEGIKRFSAMLKKAAPNMTDADRKAIESKLRKAK